MEGDGAIAKWSIVQAVMVICLTGGKVLDETLYPILKAAREAPIEGLLTLSLGNVRTTVVQRTDSAQALKDKGVKSLVLTDSRVTRGIITAISWFGGDIHALPLSDVERALDILGIQDGRRVVVRATAQRLRAEVEREQRFKHAG